MRSQGVATERIAKRVRRLRRSQGITGEQFVALLAQHGVRWIRSTLVNVETGARESLTVEELVGLAAVFNMDPALLLSAEPDCEKCYGNPPAGFTCNDCGTGT